MPNQLVGTIGKREEFTWKFTGYNGAYEGKGTGYYDVVAHFKDEDNNMISWLTTEKGDKPLPPKGTYRVKATVVQHETLGINITHVKRVKFLERLDNGATTY